MKLILASGSPRRAELMRRMQLDFTIIKSGADETVPGDLSPSEYVKSLSFRKAEFVARENADACVIGSDTVVVYRNTILGKPQSREDAYTMLRMLSGKTHTVYTGIAVVCGDRKLVDCDSTEVTFAELSDKEIYDYIDTGDPFDKAGSYGLQGSFCVHIEKICGSYFTVVGLPVHKLYSMLGEIGFRK